MKSSSKNFLTGAAVIAVGGIIAKGLGAVYRIPLTNLLGSQGMGIYQLVFPFYTLLLAISSAGIPSAISRLIAERLNLDDKKNADKIFRSSFIMLSLIGLALSAALYFLSDKIALMQGAPEAAASYKMIAPSVFFVSQIAVLRGYFQGKMNMVPTAVSQIIEQFIKIAFTLIVAISFLPDIVKAVTYSVFAVSVSEFICVLFLISYYFISKNNQIKRKESIIINQKIALINHVEGFNTLQGADNANGKIQNVNNGIDISINDVNIDDGAHEKSTGKNYDAVLEKGCNLSNSLNTNQTDLLYGKPNNETENDFIAAKTDLPNISGINKTADMKEGNGGTSTALSSSTKKLTFLSAFLLVFAVSIPVTIGSIILPLSQIIDSILVVNIIGGYYNGSVIALYGLYSGPVNSLISLPIVITSGVAVAIIPYVSASRVTQGKSSAKGKIELALKLTFLIAFPCAIGMFIFSSNIMSMLYPRLSAEDLFIASNLLKVSTLSILFLSLMQTAVSILVALKRAIITTVNLVIAVLVKLLLNYLLLGVPSVNIYGAAISAVSCYLVAATLNLLYILKFTELSLSFYKVFFKPLACAVVTIAFAFVFYVLLNKFVRADLSTIIAILLCVPIFLFSVVKAKVFTDSELKFIPLLNKFV